VGRSAKKSGEQWAVRVSQQSQEAEGVQPRDADGRAGRQRLGDKADVVHQMCQCHQRPHVHLKSPLEFNLEKEMEVGNEIQQVHDEASLGELLEQQSNLQVNAGLSASGPLTRADFGGEKPNEVESVDEDESTQMSQQANVQEWSELPETNSAGAVVNLESTVPKLMSDGRLVRVPSEQAPSVKVEPLVAPDVSSSASAPADAPLNPDMNLLLQTEEGVQAQQDPPNAPFPAKKVRVSSLVSGILSSTLSSVLTRGMQFTSAKSV